MVRLIDFVARWTIRTVVVLVLLGLFFDVIPLSKITEPVREIVHAVVDR